MDKTNRFAMMIQALTELVEEEQVSSASLPVSGTPSAESTPVLPALSSVLAEISPLPHEAIFLGMAEDGLPVLLNLYDPVPGPILITGDPSSGKTALLQTIARAAELLHPSDKVQYGIITQKPDEWKQFYRNQNSAGIFRTTDDNTRELLQSLVRWAHRNKGSEQSILLLIDDLPSISKLDEKTQQDLRWLLLRGSHRRIWSFVTLNASHAQELGDWLDFFHTRLFGHVENSEDAYFVTGKRDDGLETLTPKTQFALREGNNLLRFLIPPIE